MDALRSLAASLLLFSAAAPLALADTHELDGIYQYQTIGGNGAQFVTYRMTIGDGKIGFKNPANESDPHNLSLPAVIKEGVPADFAALIGNRPHPNLKFYKTRLDVEGRGRLSNVLITKKTDARGETTALNFYILFMSKPTTIISDAVLTNH